MTTNPRVLRREVFAEIGKLITRDATLLVDRWCRRAIAEQPGATRVHHETLRDGLGPLLKAIGHNLAQMDADGIQPRLRAIEHGEHRWQDGWALSEVVRDYQILRLVTLEYLEETLDRSLSVRETMAISLELDEAIVASIEPYVNFRDEHMRTLEERRMSQERFSREAVVKWQNVFENAGWGMALLIPPGYTISSANSAFATMHGRRLEEVADKTLFEFLERESYAAAAAHLARAGEHGQHAFECYHRGPDGKRFPVLTSVAAIGNDDGKVIYYAASFQDISDRKHLEESLRQQTDALQRAGRRKDEFLATLAHELRNPLTPILSALELMRLSDSAPGAVETALGVAERQVQQLLRLVDELLDITRVSLGKVELRRQIIDLNEIVQCAVESVRPLIESRQHALEIKLPDHSVHVDADPARTAQVLTNLLNNAAKYTDPGGHIWLTVELADGDVLVRVRDNGIGISAELLPRVFGLYTQSDSSAGRSQGGLGIGLTLVRSLVRLHGGTVLATSPGIGQGSEFVVRLPVYRSEGDDKITARAIHHEGKTTVSGEQKYRLLLVDDNRDVVAMLAILLRRVGHDVSTAHDGPTAIEAARQQRPEFILLDIGLPGMDGYQVAQELRKQPELGEAWLIAMTGYGQDEDLKRAQDAGFKHHLLKPVRFEAIQNILAERDRATGSNAC